MNLTKMHRSIFQLIQMVRLILLLMLIQIVHVQAMLLAMLLAIHQNILVLNERATNRLNG
jgi:hypothetical protein